MTFLDWVSLRKKNLMDWFISIAATTKAQGSWQKMGQERPSKPTRSELSSCNVLFPETACLIFWWNLRNLTSMYGFDLGSKYTKYISLCLWILWKANFFHSNFWFPGKRHWLMHKNDLIACRLMVSCFRTVPVLIFRGASGGGLLDGRCELLFQLYWLYTVSNLENPGGRTVKSFHKHNKGLVVNMSVIICNLL